MEEPWQQQFLPQTHGRLFITGSFLLGIWILISTAFHLGKVVTAFKTRSLRQARAQSLLAKGSDVYYADICPVVMMEPGHVQTWLFRSGTFCRNRGPGH